MKTHLIGAALAVVMSLYAGNAFAQDVTVHLTGVKAEGGQILAALQTQDQFLKPEGTTGTMAPAPPTGGDLTLVIKDVKPGVYSLSVLHDTNGDHTMAIGADGRPAEGWAMKNGMALRGRPTWPEVSFTVGKDPVVITEAMIYPQK